MSQIQTDLTAASYKGTAPAMTDLIGGQVELMCDQTTNTTQQIKGGKVKAYAVTTKKRVASLPDLPTFDESGLEGFEVEAADAGAVLDRLETETETFTCLTEVGTETGGPGIPLPSHAATTGRPVAPCDDHDASCVLGPNRTVPRSGAVFGYQRRRHPLAGP